MRVARGTAVVVARVVVATTPLSAAWGQCEYDVTAVFAGPSCGRERAIINPRESNAAGHVVGAYQCPSGFDPHAFVWPGAGPVIDVPLPPKVVSSWALGLNDKDSDTGDIVGVQLTPVDQPAGDTTGNCRVNASDLLAVLTSWGPCEGPCHADVNRDGVVDWADVEIVLTNWG